MNLRQRRWLELINDDDLGINYHPRKSNLVGDALSCRSHVSQLVVDSMPFELCEEFDKLNLRILASMKATEMDVGSNLLQEIWKGQVEMRRSKRLSAISRKRSRLAFRKMRKVCCGTREGFVCLMSRN
jgi:hypothetical protein